MSDPLLAMLRRQWELALQMIDAELPRWGDLSKAGLLSVRRQIANKIAEMDREHAA